jgi:hypothetical protein
MSARAHTKVCRTLDFLRNGNVWVRANDDRLRSPEVLLESPGFFLPANMLTIRTRVVSWDMKAEQRLRSPGPYARGFFLSANQSSPPYGSSVRRGRGSRCPQPELGWIVKFVVSAVIVVHPLV